MVLHGWHKARKKMVRKLKVNAVAKFWFRSKILRQLKSWNIRRKALDSPKLYLPLGGRMIRLLRIHPGSALEDIWCEFVYVDLDSPEDYAALSYTWGQEAPSIPILVQGKMVLVTENLYLALLHLRKRDVPTIWVDALCINQNDLQERASQVQQMKDVYQQACRVIVWLGDEDQSSTQAFDTFHEMVEHLDWDGRVPTWLMRGISEDLQRWKAIIDTLSRQWFRRTWVLQEVLAAQEVFILCGKDLILMNLFMKIIHSLLVQNLLPSIQEDGYFTSRGFPTLAKGAVMQLGFLVGARIKDVDIWTLRLRFDRKLLNLLASTRWSEATDIRDKVYGLLSLASDAKSLGWYDNSQWVSFRVDYNLSAKQVFINTAKAIMDTNKSLEILQFAGGLPNKMMGMPSWVPDWGQRSPSPSGYPHFERSDAPSKQSWRHDNEDAFESFKWRGFSDTITYSCGPAFTFDKNDALVVRGIHFDTITRISKHAEYEPKFLRSTTNAETREKEQLLDDIEHYLDSLYLRVKECTLLAARCSPYPTGESTEDALWRTLGDDLTEKKRDEPLLLEGRLRNVRATQSAFTFAKNKYLSMRSNNPDALSEIVLECATSRFETLWSACPEMLPHQRFATTRKKYMGFVPQDAEVGDIICAIYGCETPFVLRKRSRRNNFELVGNAKIQGFDFDYAVAELRGLEGRRWKKSFPILEEVGGNRTLNIKLRRSRKFTIL